MAEQFSDSPPELIGLLLRAIQPLSALVPELLMGRIRIAPDAFLFLVQCLGAQMAAARNVEMLRQLVSHWAAHSPEFVGYIRTRGADSRAITRDDFRVLDCLKLPPGPD